MSVPNAENHIEPEITFKSPIPRYSLKFHKSPNNEIVLQLSKYFLIVYNTKKCLICDRDLKMISYDGFFEGYEDPCIRCHKKKRYYFISVSVKKENIMRFCQDYLLGKIFEKSCGFFSMYGEER
jgi:hypothetical protein